MLVHMSLQQINYKILKKKELGCDFEQFETLNYLSCLHNLDASDICYTRFFGCGTLILSICFTLFWIQLNKN